MRIFLFIRKTCCHLTMPIFIAFTHSCKLIFHNSYYSFFMHR
uniref:Uncharacterized protein n=1 Tax=Siphoviridae sp. ctiOl67 TaxID=2825622 RepID=A0A8S5QJ64_9CAUD|nr:MAG TPA: hypothetical protein [Siphoviridae sp. ctiOl67]